MSDKKISELTQATSIHSDDVSVLVSDGTDYKFAFSTLLQFLSSNLTVGANITFGTSLPQNTSGKNGDVFINTTAASFAQKISGTWAVKYTLPSTNSQTDGTVLYGLGTPATSTGNNNDTYINTGTGVFYKKNSGAWGQVFSMQSGPQGPQGTAGVNGTNGINGFSVLNGTTNPSNLSTGVNGDFYINTSNYSLFGPKTSGIWGTGTSLVGTGLEPGGTTGQVLVKTSNTDYDTQWADPTSNTDRVTELPGATNKYFTVARVLAAILTGISVATGGAVVATDTVLQGIGKLQKQFNDLFKIPTGGTTGQLLAKASNTDGDAQWITPSSGGSPGGTTKQVQFNDGGIFAGDTGLTFNKVTKTLELGVDDTVVSALSILFVGDSITFGYSLTNPTVERYTALISNGLGMIENNQGQAGATVVLYTTSAIPNKTSSLKYLCIELGLNDADSGTYTAAQFKTNYQTLLTTIIGKGWAYDDLFLFSINGASAGAGATNYPAFNTAISDLCTLNGSKYVDVYNPILNSGYPKTYLQTTGDLIHLNSFAHSLLAVVSLNTMGINNFVLTNQKLAINGTAEITNIKLKNYPLKTTRKIIFLNDDNSLSMGYGLADGASLGKTFLNAGFTQVGAVLLSFFDDTKDFAFKAGALLWSGNGANQGASILLFNTATGDTEYRNYYGLGQHRWYVSGGNTGSQIEAVDIDNLGNLVAKIGIQLVQNKLIFAKAGTLQGSIDIFPSDGLSKFKNNYGLGSWEIYCSNGTNGSDVKMVVILSSGRMQLQQGGTFTDLIRARLSINSITEGFLPPRMTTTQRDAMATILGFGIIGGSGYTSTPTLTITGGGGTGATATSVISGGSITSVTLTNAGTGYTTVPTVAISGGGGSGASIIATIALAGHEGLQIHNVTTHNLNLYDGTAWMQPTLTAA
jgi:lysophospholipase L1-like esterase